MLILVVSLCSRGLPHHGPLCKILWEKGDWRSSCLSWSFFLMSYELLSPCIQDSFVRIISVQYEIIM